MDQQKVEMTLLETFFFIIFSFLFDFAKTFTLWKVDLPCYQIKELSFT